MKKNYFALAIALCLGIALAHAQTPLAPAHSVDKTITPGNNPVADLTPPTISCFQNITVNLMPTLMIQLWATDFLQYAEDNVTPVNQIQFAIRKSGSGTGFPTNGNGQPITSVLFDCDEQGPQSVEMWAKDLAGNSSYCEASVNIQDNSGNFCNGGIPGLITVHLKAGNEGVEESYFQVSGTDSVGIPFQYIIQNTNGNINVPVGSSGTITPMKDDNPLNGVSTYDIVLIGKHYTGTQPFVSPLKWIAADANRDNVVNTQDSLEFTKLILGIYDELPVNTSWRFVLSDYIFPTPDPLSQPFPESFSFTNIQGHITVDFEAIKIGDVNGSAISNSFFSNDEPPEITCLNGISVNIMPTGMISLWASDFLQFVSDDITPVNQIKLGVRKAGTGNGFPWGSNGDPNINVIYNCTELGTQTVELWAMDEAGNTSYCETPLLVQDNMSNCGEGGIMGTVCTKQFCTNNGIEEVVLEIRSDSSVFAPPFSLFDLSDDNGCWNFSNSVPLAPNFRLTPSKDGNPLEGVTSYDLELLSKHIHGIQPFTEPWQWVAADANHDNVVDIQDSIEFHKLILGIYQELPNNASWRFVRSDYVFPSPNPLSQPFPESIKVNELVDSIQVVFYGIKIGDLSVECLAQTAMKEPENNSLYHTKLSPNPTNAGITLGFQLPQAETVRIQITDVQGKLMYDTDIVLPAGIQTVDISETALLEPGMYIWNLVIDGKMMSGKLIRM